MERPWKKSEKVILVLAIFVIGFVIIGVTYSYFTINISGNEEAKGTRVTTGLLDVNFTANEYFNNNNMILINDADRATEADSINFSVGHADNSNISANYLVYIKEISISNNFKSPDFKWELLRGGSVVATGNFTQIIGTEILLTSSEVTLPVSTTHNYELRVWLSNTNEDQSSLLEGSFRGKVAVIVVAN